MSTTNIDEMLGKENAKKTEVMPATSVSTADDAKSGDEKRRAEALLTAYDIQNPVKKSDISLLSYVIHKKDNFKLIEQILAKAQYSSIENAISDNVALANEYYVPKLKIEKKTNL